MTTVSLAAAVLAAHLLGGCAFLARTSGLELDTGAPGTVAAIRNGAVHVSDVQLTVEPRVPTRGFAMIGPPLVPFLALGRADGDPQGAYLIIDLGLETAERDVRLDVTQLRVKLADGTEAPPLTFAGPVLPTGGLEWRAGAVRCGDAVKSAVIVPIAKAVEPLAIIGRVCLVVQFDVPPAQYETRFVVRVDGLARNGAPVAVPPLRFERRTRWHYWALAPFF